MAGLYIQYKTTQGISLVETKKKLMMDDDGQKKNEIGRF
ncbi:hypothetical protein SAMN05421821_101531 [Mucilaginibacter lappiensis]|uniref:Uncharacterized protein n=1 Tax=Mucilaginibacter lappiensis TaxID=354630 RepID=A0A1N6PKB8_9SPHI|nr:hypothetical protein [Mucilaginibacter lappiensis]MBB6126132.1 hypothetical protein [Mucilaginibacter lappiensis]SIQ04824.1 hypothetical protein SAMN05421821_101531 [Mucilaginibacter lappiensis]